MKKSLFGFCLIVFTFLGGHGQLFAKTDSENAPRLNDVTPVAHLALAAVDHSTMPFYGPTIIADEGSELRIEEKEEKEEQDQKEKPNEFQFYCGSVASHVAPQRTSLKLSSKLYLRQAVLRI